MSTGISYEATAGRYKYRLTRPYDHRPIDIGALLTVRTEYLELCPCRPATPGGVLTIKAGYAWDGPSGAPDVRSGVKASLVHDALYQLMRLRLLDKRNRKAVDRLFRRMLVEFGMASWMAWIWYGFVRAGGWRCV